MFKIIALFFISSSCFTITYDDFLNKLNEMSMQLDTKKIQRIINSHNSNRDIFDTMLVFAKTAVDYNPQILENIIKNTDQIIDNLIKIVCVKAVTLSHKYKTLEVEDFKKENQKILNICKTIPYKFFEVTYPEHLMVCYIASSDIKYLEKMLDYLNISDEELELYSKIKEEEIENDKNGFKKYVFFLETSRILKEQSFISKEIKYVLTNFLENHLDNNIYKHLTGILNENTDSST